MLASGVLPVHFDLASVDARRYGDSRLRELISNRLRTAHRSSRTIEGREEAEHSRVRFRPRSPR
jgi:hypothetical protein